tara:strand:+ start:2425 stop:2853 length:429 start_codon:yes stop_codon:yes gene_type:complete
MAPIFVSHCNWEIKTPFVSYAETNFIKELENDNKNPASSEKSVENITTQTCCNDILDNKFKTISLNDVGSQTSDMNVSHYFKEKGKKNKMKKSCGIFHYFKTMRDKKNLDKKNLLDKNTNNNWWNLLLKCFDNNNSNVNVKI